MRKIGSFVAAAALSASCASAATPVYRDSVNAPKEAQGVFCPDLSQCGGAVTQPTASNFNAQVVGNTPAGSADTGNPVLGGAVVDTAQPWPFQTNGNRAKIKVLANGALGVTMVDINGDTALIRSVLNTDASAVWGNQFLGVRSQSFVYDGTGVVRQRGDTVGTYSVATPTSTALNAIVPGATTAVSSGVVAKTGPGNVYRVSVTTGAQAGYLMGLNATTLPTTGATVTPSLCRVVGATSTLSVSYADMPSRWGTGVVFLFSTTGCFTYTASATAFIEWSVM